jgi:hypothetical protein
MYFFRAVDLQYARRGGVIALAVYEANNERKRRLALQGYEATP